MQKTTKKDVLELGVFLFGKGGKVSMRARSSMNNRWRFSQGGFSFKGRIVPDNCIYAASLEELVDKMKEKALKIRQEAKDAENQISGH